MSSDLERALLTQGKLVSKEMESLLPQGDDRISSAMRYSALSSGKKIRPFMLITIAEIFGVEKKHSLRVAAAVEMVHSYSLIHDDLPSMDDDDFRRGLPSCHKKFDEATAILAGDSLLTLAFEILADPATHPDSSIRCHLIKVLAENIGHSGMAGGQMLDLIYEREIPANYTQLVEMQWMKTARLFMASCSMGAILGYASLKEQQHLTKYAELFGLAFQFMDDLEDVSENKVLSDNNVVKLLGEKETKLAIKKLVDEAYKELTFLDKKFKMLESLLSEFYLFD
jgi:farnesyl diphosphate synthase